jgi:uncharacterized protein YdgA (DUF945 family)
MKRRVFFFLLISVVVAATALAASRYWFGIKTEEQFRAYLQELNQPGISVAITDYERGFFDSTARTVLSLKVYSGKDGSGGNVISLPLQHTIIHGPLVLGGLPSMATVKPLLAYVVTEPVKVDEGSGLLSSFFSELPLVQHTLIRLDGSSEIRLQSASFDQVINGDNERVFLNMLGSSAQMELGPGMNRVSGTMQMDGFTLEGEEGEVGFKNMSVEVDMHKGDYDLTLGTGTIHLDEVSMVGFSQGNAQSVVMRGVSGEFLSRLDGASLFSRQQIFIEYLEIAGHMVGPLEYAFELRNLDAAALGKIQQQVAKLQAGNGTSMAVNQQLKEQILQLLPQLLLHSPELEITKARATTSYGDVNGRLLLRVNNPNGAANLFALLGALHIEVDARMPEALLLKTVDTILQSSKKGSSADGRELIAQLVQQGFLKLENNIYSTSMRFEEGTFSINGNKIPLQDLLQKIQPAS